MEAYARFFHDYDAAPLLIVNAAESTSSATTATTRSCWRQIARIRRGRHFFNPLKSLL